VVTKTQVRDGCRKHGMSAADVARWWARVEAQDAHVTMCVCCLGPAPLPPTPDGTCKRCGEAA